MPRPKSRWKRKFRGNKYSVGSVSESNQSTSANSLVSVSNEDPSPSSSEVRPSSQLPKPKPVSSSKKKLSYLPEFIDNIINNL